MLWRFACGSYCFMLYISRSSWYDGMFSAPQLVHCSYLLYYAQFLVIYFSALMLLFVLVSTVSSFFRVNFHLHTCSFIYTSTAPDSHHLCWSSMFWCPFLFRSSYRLLRFFSFGYYLDRTSAPSCAIGLDQCLFRFRSLSFALNTHSESG